MHELDSVFMNLVRPYVGMEMMRLGDANDGGYVLPKVVVEETRILVSLGYGHNSKFERAFLQAQKKLRCRIFDKDIKLSVVFSETLRQFEQKLKGSHGRPLVWTKALARYISLLYTPRLKYFVSEVVASGNLEGQTVFNSLLEKSTASGQLTLKIDIEGGEYSCLESLCGDFSRIECLIVEFHDIRLELERLKVLLSAISTFMVLVNTHFNNYSKIIEGKPDCVELTFISKRYISSADLKPANRIPSDLDSPCNPKHPEITFIYKN